MSVSLKRAFFAFLTLENQKHCGFLNFNIKFTKFKKLLSNIGRDRCFTFLIKFSKKLFVCFPQKMVTLRMIDTNFPQKRCIFSKKGNFFDSKPFLKNRPRQVFCIFYKVFKNKNLSISHHFSYFYR